MEVHNGVVMAQEDELGDFEIPSMENMFDYIEERCFQSCPYKGPARCKASYNVDGSLRSLLIDQTRRVVDEEIIYTITNVEMC